MYSRKFIIQSYVKWKNLPTFLKLTVMLKGKIFLFFYDSLRPSCWPFCLISLDGKKQEDGLLKGKKSNDSRIINNFVWSWNQKDWKEENV